MQMTTTTTTTMIAATTTIATTTPTMTLRGKPDWFDSALPTGNICSIKIHKFPRVYNYCAKNYESCSAADKVIAIIGIIISMLYFEPPGRLNNFNSYRRLELCIVFGLVIIQGCNSTCVVYYTLVWSLPGYGAECVGDLLGVVDAGRPAVCWSIYFKQHLTTVIWCSAYHKSCTRNTHCKISHITSTIGSKQEMIGTQTHK